MGLWSGLPYLSGELPSGARGSPSCRCSPSGPGPGAEPLPLLQLPRSMPVGGAAVRALVLKRSRGGLLRMRRRRAGRLLGGAGPEPNQWARRRGAGSEATRGAGCRELEAR